jgi:MFS family permease
MASNSANVKLPIEHTEDPSGADHTLEKPPPALDPIAALNDPDWKAKEKKLVRTLDMTLLPMLWILYLFNYLDRTSIAQARLNSFEQDLGLVGSQFNIAVSVLTAGYMAAQLPSNMLITRIRPSLYLPGAAIIWSFVSAATAAATGFGSLVGIRVCLGIVEAPLYPGAVYVMSCWYTRSELALRFAVLYTGLVLAMAVSGLIAAGVFAGLDGVNGLAGWQWLFILEGALGCLFAIMALFVLPDYPDSKTGSTRWSMTEDLRRLAAARMEADRVSEPQSTRSVWGGLRLSLTDYKTYLFVRTPPSFSCQLANHRRAADAFQPRNHGLLWIQQLLPLHRAGL